MPATLNAVDEAWQGIFSGRWVIPIRMCNAWPQAKLGTRRLAARANGRTDSALDGQCGLAPMEKPAPRDRRFTAKATKPAFKVSDDQIKRGRAGFRALR